MQHQITVRRLQGVIPPPPAAAGQVAAEAIEIFRRNLERLGYRPSAELLAACEQLSQSDFADFHRDLLSELQVLTGSHVAFEPLYPAFPEQVRRMPFWRLFINAQTHYLTSGRWRPRFRLRLRPADDAAHELTELRPVSDIDLCSLMGNLIHQNNAFTGDDRTDLSWFVRTRPAEAEDLLPDTMRRRENAAYLVSWFLSVRPDRLDLVTRFCRSATDVLRLAAVCSEGDASLATHVRFKSFGRRMRRAMLSVIEAQECPAAEMQGLRERWLRLGERIHPGEFASEFPAAAEAFRITRNRLPTESYYSRLERQLSDGNFAGAAAQLAERPGQFARRLDHLFRLAGEQAGEVLARLETCVDTVPTPILLQLASHFGRRAQVLERRTFFPKGNVARAFTVEKPLHALDPALCERTVALLERTLRKRFAALEPLGNVYLDPALENFPAPFATRSASRAFRTLSRGSRLDLPPGDTIRFFLWWTDGPHRTDVDLSAAVLDENYILKQYVAYYQLKSECGVHSGDIVSAPNGAAEFVDISIPAALKCGGRYLAMTVNMYWGGPFCDLPECFAGWMARSRPGSGEIFEPRTVVDRLDLTADTHVGVPLVVDLANRKLIWCDLALGRAPTWQNSLHNNLRGVTMGVRAFVELQRPTLHDLFRLHATARGQLVSSPALADTVFSVEAGTPFKLDEIGAHFLA